jgi:alcohol oxidase
MFRQFYLGKVSNFDSDNRATGVAYTFNPLFHPDGPTETRTVRGTKLVVLSAGSFGTPGILERSGIGAKAILEGVGVKQRVELPSIGENYQGPSLLRNRSSPTVDVADFGT